MVATNTNDEDKEMTENRYELNKKLGADAQRWGYHGRAKP